MSMGITRVCYKKPPEQLGLKLYAVDTHPLSLIPQKHILDPPKVVICFLMRLASPDIDTIDGRDYLSGRVSAFHWKIGCSIHTATE